MIFLGEATGVKGPRRRGILEKGDCSYGHGAHIQSRRPIIEIERGLSHYILAARFFMSLHLWLGATVRC